MNRLAPVLIVGACLLAGCAPKQEVPLELRATEGRDAIVGIAGEDAEMNLAMTRARATLDEFERRLERPPSGQTEIGLKGRFEWKGGVEHMWIREIVVSDDGYDGVLENEPVNESPFTIGQHVHVARADVSDWLAVEDGRMVGGYTLRVIRARLPAEQRAQFDEANDFRIED